MDFEIIGSLLKAFNHKFVDLVDALIRNPCFLSYFIMFFSMLSIRSSLSLLVLILVALTIYHKMVLKEERYLLGVHGGEYEEYKKILAGICRCSYTCLVTKLISCNASASCPLTSQFLQVW